ncbi:MAG: oxidoreductase [Sandaracinus sp.]|nr:oxidoreductase [Sandaracinus sp.]|tara:strand:- start:1005 stop:1889 length:885 start_codon:yes stop_codon:yes gene_type:complete
MSVLERFFAAEAPLDGRRVLITGAARGIGAALARRLHGRGARVALIGLEPAALREVARECGDAPFMHCDVTDRASVEAAVDAMVQRLGGLDVVVANAGVAAQVPVIDGNPSLFERTVAVNLLGAYYTLRSAGPHVAHPGGYVLVVSSLAAAIHVPMLGAYAASKAGVEALANAFRSELRSSGARLGIAYFAELDTDMTSRGFGTRAAAALVGDRQAAPLKLGTDALERGIAGRRRWVVAPGWVAPILPLRSVAQRVVERMFRGRTDEALDLARDERPELTTPQPAVAASQRARP